MAELSLKEMIKYLFECLVSSKILVLLILEIAILLIAVIFCRLMNKKVVSITCISTGLLILAFYMVNYIDTIITFINNVSTKLVELIYFPTTLQFMSIMIISFGIMLITLINKKDNKLLKIINSALPISISFIFLCIIEYINTNEIPFDEFSVFTNPILMSLYEIGMGLFISWLLGLVIYKIDIFVINKVSSISVSLPIKKKKTVEDEIELPRLKSSVNA